MAKWGMAKYGFHLAKKSSALKSSKTMMPSHALNPDQR
jgi:hypothetical protein